MANRDHRKLRVNSECCFHFCEQLNVECVKDTHREDTRSNKSQALMGGMNMDISEISTLNQLFIRGSYTQIKFSKKVVSGKIPLFARGTFSTTHSFCLNPNLPGGGSN